MDFVNYSQKANWYRIPEITKDVDTFYIYSTIYVGANEGEPEYAPLDNKEVLEGIELEIGLQCHQDQNTEEVR